MTTIRTVAIIGAGQMGSGIAQAVATGGYAVRLYDADLSRLPLAHGTIANSLARRVERESLGADEAQAILGRITDAADLAAVGTADLVIEAAVEDEAVKRYEAAFVKAREFKITNAWTIKILKSLNKYKPSDYPLFKEEKRMTARRQLTAPRLLNLSPSAKPTTTAEDQPEDQGAPSANPSVEEPAPEAPVEPSASEGEAAPDTGDSP